MARGKRLRDIDPNLSRQELKDLFGLSADAWDAWGWEEAALAGKLEPAVIGCASGLIPVDRFDQRRDLIVSEGFANFFALSKWAHIRWHLRDPAIRRHKATRAPLDLGFVEFPSLAYRKARKGRPAHAYARDGWGDNGGYVLTIEGRRVMFAGIALRLGGYAFNIAPLLALISAGSDALPPGVHLEGDPWEFTAQAAAVRFALRLPEVADLQTRRAFALANVRQELDLEGRG